MCKGKPFFSVVIPTYNCAETLDTAIDSLLSQEFGDFEIIIVDGLSVDRTLEIIGSFNSEKIKMISEKDNGVYDAMNKGIKMAKGEWIYFLGSDDRLYENSTLKKIANLISQYCPDMIYGNVLIEGESIWAKDGQIYNGEYLIEKLVRSNICHQAVFYKRLLLLEAGGYNIDYVVCADWDINFNFFANYKIQYTNQIIAFFTSSGLSSAKVLDKFLENDIIIKLRTYFGWSLFNKHFFNWKHILKKNANQFFKRGNVFKGFIYWAAYKYHNLRSI
jgi:glycosyltransferase involved in cell wall biosynthesis